MSRVSNRFYFNMFKWKMISGDLKSRYKSKKKYYSTAFNIDMLLDLINEYGNIEQLVVCPPDGEEMDFNKYRELNKDVDINRNRKYLSIIGEWR